MQTQYTFTAARGNLRSLIDSAYDNSLPIKVVSRNGKNVYIIAEDEYSSLEETSYLLSSPANKKMLLNSMKEKPKDMLKFDNMNEAIKYFDK